MTAPSLGRLAGPVSLLLSVGPYLVVALGFGGLGLVLGLAAAEAATWGPL